MKQIKKIIPVAAVILSLATASHAQVLVNDTWADGTRNNQNLPTESAWFSTAGAALTATTGAMNWAVPGGSILMQTYFTPSGSPQVLNVGDSLRLSLDFTASNFSPAGNNLGFRFGLYDFSGGTRATADGGSTSGFGAGVDGYVFNLNMAQTFGTPNPPLQAQVRTNAGDANLMGSVPGTIYSSLGSGTLGSLSGQPGFSNNVVYTLEITATRTASDTMALQTAFYGENLGVTNSWTDNSSYAAFQFDAFAIRPAGSTSTAGNFTFSQFSVEYLPIPEPSVVALGGMAVLSCVFLYRRSRK